MATQQTLTRPQVTSQQLVELITAKHNEVLAQFSKSGQRQNELDGRVRELELHATRGHRAGLASEGLTGVGASWGATVAGSEEYRAFCLAGARGTARIKVAAALTSAPTSAGGMVAPDRQGDVIALPQRPLTVRALLQPGRTGSNLVQFVRQTVRTNAAAAVAEGAQKPETTYEFELAEAPVRTIAHWVPVSRQMMDDAPQLQSVVDSELRFGLAAAEEDQILFGDGTGQNLLGLVPQATVYAPPFAVAAAQALDTILLAVAQVEQALVPATGIVLNSLDWRRMQTLKDGQQRYLGAGPFGPSGNLLWNLPVAATPAMPAGQFLVGGFSLAAQLIDRMEPEVLLSSEDKDNFVKNMLTARAEERIALAVKRPQALVHGAFPPSP